MSDLMGSFQGAADEVQDTRKSVDQPLGMVIAAILGDARVKKLFDEAGKHPDEYQGVPTGEAALKMGVITQNTKTALLVAQAGERTLRLMDRVGKFLEQRPELLKTLTEKTADGKDPDWQVIDERMAKIKQDIGGLVDLGDPIFKFVGSERDAVVLQQAQGTWMAAQAYLNYEARALEEEAAYAGVTGRPISTTQGDGPVAGFRQAAAGFYARASELLEKGGHKEAALKFAQVAETIKEAYSGKDAPTPLRYVDDLLSAERRTVLDANIALEREHWSVLNEDILEKLIRLTGKPDMTNEVVQSLTAGTDEKLTVGKPLKIVPRTPVTG